MEVKTAMGKLSCLRPVIRDRRDIDVVVCFVVFNGLLSSLSRLGTDRAPMGIMTMTVVSLLGLLYVVGRVVLWARVRRAATNHDDSVADLSDPPPDTHDNGNGV